MKQSSEKETVSGHTNRLPILITKKIFPSSPGGGKTLYSSHAWLSAGGEKKPGGI